MEELLKKIFTEINYEPKQNGVPFFQFGDKAYYFWISLDEDVIKPFRKRSDLDSNISYKAVLDAYSDNVNSGTEPALEKNANLIVLVKVGDIASLTTLQQQILLIEEDEYFFKKYVILYTDNCITGLIANPIIPDLRVKVNDAAQFKSFFEHGYITELAQYLVILQLFVKLPFLNLEHGSEDFTSLNDKIQTALDGLSTLKNSLLSQSTELLQIDFANRSHEDRINNLMSLL
jgi:hypothetical protein